MRVTETTIQLAGEDPNFTREGVLAYVNIVLDNALAVKNLRLVRTKNRLIVCMPSRDMLRNCPKCRGRVPISGKYCRHCGGKLPYQSTDKVSMDMVHPISSELRTHIEHVVKEAYQHKRATMEKG